MITTDRISIPALRGFQGHHLTIADAQRVVAALPALVEAVEAARRYQREAFAAAGADTPVTFAAARDLVDALARFDFGEAES